jgi:hypothetical protein
MPSVLGHAGDPACFTNGTAMEVSAYRFHEVRTPASMHATPEKSLSQISPSLSLSAWRVGGLQEDPLAFSGGVKLHWRIAEYINFKLPSPKCFINEPNATAGDKSLGGAPTTVTSYVWVYTW